jgi:hypothetical protein
MLRVYPHALTGVSLILLLGQCERAKISMGKCSASAPHTAEIAVEPVDFNRDVRPILSDRCFACHGPDAAKGREAGLRLDTFEGATMLLESGKRAIVPGHPEASEMVNRMHTHDPELLMPPAKLDRPLTTEEKAILENWIRQGAEYQPHWAFVPPVSHEPSTPADKDWGSDAIDHFTHAAMTHAGLEPNPEADPSTLLRRASLTLTGLPPSPDQVAAFLKDPSPEAFAREVDAMLASPRFGERMAQEWLDVSRFADTYGYQSDKPNFTWPWRDWVIRAFNDNLPHDDFIVWQIAGDMLPDATQDQKLATTFNRLHRQTEEGGSIEAEFRMEYVADRVHTYGTAFLGLTMECSRCHDHKYDPIPQEDYYSLASMFGQIDESGLLPYSISTSAPPPSMHLMEPHHPAEVAKRRAALDQAENHAASLPATRKEAFDAWLASAGEISTPAPLAHYPLDAIENGKLANAVPGAAAATLSGGSPKPVPGAAGQAMEFDGDTVLNLPGTGGITRHDPVSLSLHLFSPDSKDRAVILHSGPSMYSQAADASGFELLLEKGRLRWSCIALWPGSAASIETAEPFPTGRWVHVTATYDGSSSAAGLRLFIDGVPSTTNVVRDRLDRPIVANHFQAAARPRDDRGFARGGIDDLRLFRAVLTPADVSALRGASLFDQLQLARQGDATARDGLFEWYLRHIDGETIAARQAAIEARKQLYDHYLDHIPQIMCMEESPYKKQFHILQRGDYASPDLSRPVKSGAVPAVMDFDEKRFSRDRLGLAKWTVDPANPLTARVAVNRFWLICFGRGIVPTQENFGLQGDAPSHPELLDTLARDFVDSGWDVKALLRRIVLSATFRQSSTTTEEKLAKDPRNILLSRGPSYRLSAEAIRDQALFAAGLLVEKTGGPSVKPWQPDGVWSEAGAAGGDYQPDTGEGRYRRSIYTFIKRTAPPPGMVTLDAGSREICLPQRLSTNTPLQPLIFLNDLGFFECARGLAARSRKEAPDSPRAAIERAFLILTSRPPRPAEIDALLELHETKVEHFTNHTEDAAKVAGQPDPALAAMTLVCSTLLTADAVITNR